ncbi:hypothetical protein MRY82_06165 [bacterium]|nr:hypothetical protein [bacterium]
MTYKHLQTYFLLGFLTLTALVPNSYAQITGDNYNTKKLAQHSRNFVALPDAMNAALFSFVFDEYIKPYDFNVENNTVSANFMGLLSHLELHKNTTDAYLLTEHETNIENPKNEHKVIYTHWLSISGRFDLNTHSSFILYSLDGGFSWFFELDNEAIPYLIEKENKLLRVHAALTTHLKAQKK